MFEAINTFLLMITDPLLNWALSLPRFLVLVLLAVCTALVLTGVRKFTTNQDRLGRAQADKGRLKQFLREAKKAGDADAVKRYRGTMGEIGMVNMKSELLPLCASLIPIALLATWAFARISYDAPQADKPITVKAFFATSEIGNLVHLVPQPGLQTVDDKGQPTTAWIQRIAESKDREGKVDGGTATWQVQCMNGGGKFVLPIRYQGKVYEKDLLVDGRKYAVPLQAFPDAPVLALQTVLPDYQPLGLIPKIPPFPVKWIGVIDLGFISPWLLGYLIIVIPLSFLLKPVLRIH